MGLVLPTRVFSYGVTWDGGSVLQNASTNQLLKEVCVCCFQTNIVLFLPQFSNLCMFSCAGTLESRYGLSGICSMFEDPHKTPKTLRVSHVWTRYIWHQHRNCVSNGEGGPLETLYWDDCRALFFVGLDSFSKHFTDEERMDMRKKAEAAKVLGDKLGHLCKAMSMKKMYDDRMQEMFISNPPFDAHYPFNLNYRIDRYKSEVLDKAEVSVKRVVSDKDAAALKMGVFRCRRLLQLVKSKEKAEEEEKELVKETEKDKKKRKKQVKFDDALPPSLPSPDEIRKTEKLLSMESLLIRDIVKKNAECGPAMKGVKRNGVYSGRWLVPGWHKPNKI